MSDMELAGFFYILLTDPSFVPQKVFLQFNNIFFHTRFLLVVVFYACYYYYH